MRKIMFCGDEDRIRSTQLANITALLTNEDADRFINYYLKHSRIHPVLSRKLYHTARQQASYRWGEDLFYKNLQQSMQFIFDDPFQDIDYDKVS